MRLQPPAGSAARRRPPGGDEGDLKGWPRARSGLFVIVLLAGCGLGEEKNGAEYFVGSFFETAKVKDFNTVLTLYAPRFFEKTPRAERLRSLQKMKEKLGDLQEYRLVGWNFRKRWGTGGSGTCFQFR